MLNIKYRVHEVAKDFGRNSKEIVDILTTYATAPKNHMQALTELELTLIFEYLTQHNQVESIESVFADVYHEPEKAEPTPAPTPAPAVAEEKAAPAAESKPTPAADQAAAPAAPSAAPASHPAAQQKPQQPLQRLSLIHI